MDVCALTVGWSRPATRTISNAKSSADEKTYEHFRVKLEEAKEQSYAAVADAENAYATVRMLIPSVADQARHYLDLCIKANVYPDEEKDARQRARQEVEEKIRRAFGGDLPANWMVAEPAPKPRWWQIRRRRAAKPASLARERPASRSQRALVNRSALCWDSPAAAHHAENRHRGSAQQKRPVAS